MTRHLLAASAACVAAAGCGGPSSSDVLTASGHVEATEVRVAGQVGGRLVELRAAEGDRLAAGDLTSSRCATS